MKRLLWCALLGVLLCPAAARAQTDEVVYYHTDAIGSVRMITDATGTVLARYDFAPFGEKWDPQPNPDRLQFSGKERDSETGLDYFGARYYRPESGRFLSVDPKLGTEVALFDPQRWNRYSYVSNRPVTFVDPDGRDPRLVGGAIGAAVYTAWNAAINLQQGNPWYRNATNEASKGFLVGFTLGLAAPAIGLPSAATAAAGSPAATTVIGFSRGTGGSAFVSNRLQHASRHLTEAGILGDWSKATGQKFAEIGAKILENPSATFDHVLRGGDAVKGFLGNINGRDVAFLVYKSGENAGQIATAIVPTTEQLTRWGLR